MSLWKPGRLAIAFVAIVLVGFVGIKADWRSVFSPHSDQGLREEPGPTLDDDEFTDEVLPQVSVQEDNSAKSEKGFWVGRFETLEIPVRDAPPYEHPDVAAAYAGDDSSLFDTLVELGMAGNAVASLNLHDFLDNCDRLYKTEEELEAAINRMYEIRNFPNASPGNLQKDNFHPAHVEANVRKTFAQCREVPDEAIQNRGAWLQRAAEDGNPLAIVAYGDSIAAENPGEAFEVYSRLWELGGAMGADKLSKMYTTGWEGHEPDLVRAAAYGYIATEYMLGYFDKIGNPYGAPIFDIVRQGHVDLQQEMLYRVGPGDFDRAFELAHDLLQKNPNCCFN